ncbi:NAD(P)-binding protein [Xylariaceae sp. AK1471]|nr:NAD(P)-binding protein [Xylariaceae sp. AK1471]
MNVTTHHEPYPAINPTRPELSQRGRAVLVTGSSSGIGFYIARAFAKANAATVILTGRQENSLTKAVETLTSQYPETSFIGRALDIADSAAVEEMWNQFDSDGLVIDVLVLNAARIQFNKASLLDRGHDEVIADYTTNVGANLQFVEHFYHQKNRDTSKKLVLLNVSTFSIHNFEVNKETPSYGLSKNAAALLMQLIAQEVPASDMQVLSFHPGFIYTFSAKTLGFGDDLSLYDHDDLPGHYAVWAASDEAAFLHGRYTWTEWDVEELSSGEIRHRIDNDSKYLRLGLLGL